MSKVIHLKKGLDILLKGVAEKVLANAPASERYAVKPADFVGVQPKLLVKVDDMVKAGEPLFFDKSHPEVLFCSPVSGKVADIVRGDKRKLLEVVVLSDEKRESKAFDVANLSGLSVEKIKELLLSSGLWPMIIQRPYGVIANPQDTPRDIFVSAFDSAPLAPDFDFILQTQGDEFLTGLEVLKKLTTGKVYLGLSDTSHSKVYDKLNAVEQNVYVGHHPAGNVGVQIHHIAPINKGETVWTVDLQNLTIIGRFFRSGKIDMAKIIALTGSEIAKPRYYRAVVGAQISSIVNGNISEQKEGCKVRIISGNVLTGTSVASDGYLSYYSNQVTVIPEGDHSEFFGWIAPRFKKFSMSHSYFSWLTPKKIGRAHV